MAALERDGELVLDRGEGAHVWDVNGDRYLDATAGPCLSGIPANAAGHGELIADVVEVPWDDPEALGAAVDAAGSDRVAAFFCEPVIGAGGVYPPPEGYLEAVRATCRETGVLFV